MALRTRCRHEAKHERADAADARLHHPARAAGRPRHAGDVGARLRRRLCGRQPDRRADLARRDAGHPRRRRSRRYGLDRPLYEQYFIFLGNILRGDLGRSFVFGMPVLAAHHAAGCRRRWSSPSSPVIGATLIGVPLGIYAGYRPDSPASKAIMARLDPRLLGADLLGRADPDPVLRRLSRLAAGRQPRRDGARCFGVEWSFLTLERAGRTSSCRRSNLSLVQARHDDPPRPRRHARDHAHRHGEVRARRRALGSDDPAPARPEADLDPDRHGVRPGVRLDARLRGRDRDDLLLARRRQADHRFDHARSTGR